MAITNYNYPGEQMLIKLLTFCCIYIYIVNSIFESGTLRQMQITCM